jgi:hypothetical protein
MNNAPNQYKVCALNVASTISFYQNYIVSLLNTIFQQKEVIFVGQLYRGVVDSSFYRVVETPFEKYRKTMTEGKAGREWNRCPAHSSFLLILRQSRELCYSLLSHTIQDFWFIQSSVES